MFELTLWQIWDFNVNTCITSRLKQPQQKLTYLCTLKILLFFQNLVRLLYGFPVVSIVQAICTPTVFEYTQFHFYVYNYFFNLTVYLYIYRYVSLYYVQLQPLSSKAFVHFMLSSQKMHSRKTTTTTTHSLWKCYNRSNHSACYNSLYASIIPKWSITQVLDS